MRETVLPPVLGPLMMSWRASLGRAMVSGMGARGGFAGFAGCGAHAEFEERVAGGGEGDLRRRSLGLTAGPSTARFGLRSA